MTLIYAIFNNVAAHPSFFPLQSVDLLPAKMKHCVQLHLLPTASALDAATATIVSVDSNYWNNVTWGWVSSRVLLAAIAQKINGMKALAELALHVDALRTSWKCLKN